MAIKLGSQLLEDAKESNHLMLRVLLIIKSGDPMFFILNKMIVDFLLERNLVFVEKDLLKISILGEEFINNILDEPT